MLSWYKVSDGLQTFDSATLMAIAAGTVDARAAAVRCMIGRGLDRNCRWVGSEAAKESWDQ